MPPTYNPPKTKTSSSPYRSDVDAPEALVEKDRYFGLQNDIITKENAIAKIKSDIDALDSDEIKNAKSLIELYEQQQTQLKNKQDALYNLNQERRNERAEILKTLQDQYGVNASGVDDNDSLVNYQEILDKKLDAVNSLRGSKDKVAYTNAKDEYDDLNRLVKRFYEIQLTDIPKTSEEWYSLNKDINKCKDSIEDINVNIFKDASDKRLEESERWIEQQEALDKVAESGVKFTGEDKLNAYNRIITGLKSDLEQINTMEGITATKRDELWQETYQKLEDWQLKYYEQEKTNIQGLQSDLERYYSNITDRLQDRAENYDYLIQKEQALVDAQQKQYDTQNKIRDIQKDIKSQWAASKVMSEYLDEDTQKLLFNEDDYNASLDSLEKLDRETSRLHRNYVNDISSLNKNNMYLEEAITKEYERRLAMKEKEYEIAQAQLNLNKKQTELNNILNEKNVRMLIGTEWVNVANTEDVAKATEELVSLEEEMANIKLQSEQQRIINRKQEDVDQLTQEQAALNNRIKIINDNAEKMSKAFENYLNPVKDMTELTTELVEVSVPQLGKAISKFINSMSSVTGISSSENKSTTGNIREKIIDMGGTKVGAFYDSSGKLIKIKQYASGTQSAIGGVGITDEEGYEAKLRQLSSGKYTLLNEGDKIFNANDTKNLWDWAKINPNTGFLDKIISGLNMPNIENRTNVTGDTNYNFNGITIEHVNDVNDFTTQMAKKARGKAILTKNM